MIELYDTTLRDGTQGEGVCLTVKDKLRIATMLDEFGMAIIEGGWPGSNPKDIEFFDLAKRHTWKNARLAAFGSTCRPSLSPDQYPSIACQVASASGTDAFQHGGVCPSGHGISTRLMRPLMIQPAFGWMCIRTEIAS